MHTLPGIPAGIFRHLPTIPGNAYPAPIQIKWSGASKTKNHQKPADDMVISDKLAYGTGK